MKKLCKTHQEKVCDLHKARVDEGLSPNSKAAARVARGNVRYHYDSPKDTHNRPADEASWERGHVPHAGKPGEKVTGLVPSRHGASIHTHGDYEKGTPKSSAHESHKIAMEDIKSTKFNKSEPSTYSAKHVANHINNSLDEQDPSEGAHQDVIDTHVMGHPTWELKRMHVNNLTGYHNTSHAKDDASIRDKVDRFKEMGIGEPAAVAVPHPTKAGKFHLIDGKHRHLANIESGVSHMDVYVPKKINAVKDLKKNEDDLCDIHKASVPNGTQNINGVEVTKHPRIKRRKTPDPLTHWSVGDKKYFSHPDYPKHKLYAVGPSGKSPESKHDLTPGHEHIEQGTFKDHAAIVEHLSKKPSTDVAKSEDKMEFGKHEEGFHDPRTNESSSDPCPYCADNEDNRTDDCTYCQTLDAEENANGTAGMHDCQACNDYDQKNEPKEGIDDCPYCQTENITVEQAYPEKEPQHVCNCPNCEQNKDQTGLAVEDMGAEHPNNCPECQKMYGDAIENEPGQTAQEDPNLQGHETAEEVLDLLDQEPGKGAETPKEEASKIDNTELPQGNATDANVSVKENFGQAQRDDDSQPELGSDSQDEPDVTGILKDGLDEHAQDMQKQKVLDMVSQTLQGFKANKASLEATKEQNQALYSSCIQMLKSMIELCKLLGLEPKMASREPKEVSEEPETEPQNAAPSEGAAEAPKAQSGV
jgi:hypothetical protein